MILQHLTDDPEPALTEREVNAPPTPQIEITHPSQTMLDLARIIAVSAEALSVVHLGNELDVVVQHLRVASTKLSQELQRCALGEKEIGVGIPSLELPTPSDEPSDVHAGWRGLEDEHPIAVPGLTVDVQGCAVRIHGERIDLSVTELRLLAVLALNYDRAVPTDMLTELAFGAGAIIDIAALRSRLARLRRKLRSVSAPCVPLAVMGFGYRLSPEPGPLDDHAADAQRTLEHD